MLVVERVCAELEGRGSFATPSQCCFSLAIYCRSSRVREDKTETPDCAGEPGRDNLLDDPTDLSSSSRQAHL